ncbi:WD40 repeat-like protein [Choiromyces venosus 120613-1]|uniref:WD40 repeat-like protein n=1 Tax=Choiromyces venosus 120613-1 TaxID=1336337 RepID=A0A3N4K371_9PEZI|nr:WD40 repeat-like protein [Choiromyces venosus 120613-1]
MPALDSSALLVARFLKSNGYEKSLKTFLEEANLDEKSLDPGPGGGLTIEKVLDEKRQFDLSLSLEKVAITENNEPEFSIPYPSIPHAVSDPDILASNVLFVLVADISTLDGPALIITTADRALRIYSATAPYKLLRSHTHLHPSAILCCAVLQSKWLISTSMSGHVVISDAASGDVISNDKPHVKYVVKVLVHEKLPYVITSGYDNTIVLHSLTYEEEGRPKLSELHRLRLSAHPEAISFVTLPTGEDALVYSLRDSTFLNYHLLTPSLPAHSKRNLSPTTTSWVTFHAMSILPHPNDGSILGVVTSSVPHMKFLLVRVDSEEIITEVFTGAPQSAYSTAVFGWRVSGDGVWVNGDDGVVRGIERKSGKVMARLKASEGGEKVRSLWTGAVDGKEVLVTGGFDKAIKVWVPEE